VLNVKEEAREIAIFTNYVVVKAVNGKSAEALKSIEETWKEFSPGRPFSYTILSSELDKLYREEEYLGQASAILALLTILIAGIGLFGLVSFMAMQRTHEIGIRKVLGASSFNLVRLLTSGFIKLVGLSILLAWPLSYFIIDRWFDNFAYRTEMKWQFFLLAGVLSLLLTIAITGVKAFNASRLNPSETLKYE
jgi:putative ABC transport system permease protein